MCLLYNVTWEPGALLKPGGEGLMPRGSFFPNSRRNLQWTDKQNPLPSAPQVYQESFTAQISRKQQHKLGPAGSSLSGII